MIRFDDIIEKASYLGEKDILLLQKAYIYAAKAHKGQVRRSGEPYLSHPLEVTAMLADMRLDTPTLVAGLLHDVMEDTDVPPEELRELFGREAAVLVEGVTKIGRVQDASTEAGRAETIRKIILAMTDDLRVIFIKLADRIHNLKTLKFLDENKQRRIARETLEIYAPVANRLGMGRIRAELEDLAFRYVEPEEFFRIAALVDPRRKAAEKSLAQFKKKLEALMKDNGIPAEIEFRIKRLYSISSKMKRRTIDFDQVYDFLALRLITDTERNCYAALGLIHQTWSHLPQRFRDFIAMPKPNLYQSLHTTIITGEKQTFEIQIRTRGMHELADNGIAAHWKYKEGSPPEIQKDDRRLTWLRELAALYQEQKNPREFMKTLKSNLIPEEVYVFTPKGHVITLPPGATALDFAFKIHTAVGLHASGARINGSLAALKTVLKTGDIVEILTDPAKTPSRAWLSAVATSAARQQIRRWLSLKSRTTSLTLGKKLWEREIRKYALPSALLENKELLIRLGRALKTKLKHMDEFYRMAGTGRVVVDKRFLEAVFSGETLEPKKATFFDKVVSRVRKDPPPGLALTHLEEQMVSIAKCCSPIKGEPIIGYLTAGKGITVHAVRCPLVAKEILDAHRMMDVHWDPASGGTFKAGLLIHTENTPGVLAGVAGVIAKLEGNIVKAEVKTLPDGKGRISLELHIRDIDHLETIRGRLAALKDVNSVHRP